jgi:hypothetical protein
VISSVRLLRRGKKRAMMVLAAERERFAANKNQERAF